MEKNNNSDRLKLLIKTLVKEELKAQSKEIAKIIKEQVRLQVKQQVNEILAEQFLKNISTNNSINTVFTEKQEKLTENISVKNKKVQDAERSAIREKYNQKLRNLGVLGTEAQSLFEDIQSGPIAASPGAVGNPLELDDDGVDLSHFGY